MSVSEDDHTTPEELTALCERGVHFVLCRAADDGPKKAKSAIKSRWQTKAAALKDVLKHHAAGGLLGFIPGRSGLWVLDVDRFPGETKDPDGLLASVSALATISTPRGIHAYLKKPSSDPIGNRAWAVSGYGGDIRADAGYAIVWQLDKLADALDRLPGAAPTAHSLFPKPSGRQPAEGNRNNTLNADVFKAAQRGETDFSKHRAAAEGDPCTEAVPA